MKKLKYKFYLLIAYLGIFKTTLEFEPKAITFNTYGPKDMRVVWTTLLETFKTDQTAYTMYEARRNFMSMVIKELLK